MLRKDNLENEIERTHGKRVIRSLMALGSFVVAVSLLYGCTNQNHHRNHSTSSQYSTSQHNHDGNYNENQNTDQHDANQHDHSQNMTHGCCK